MNQYSNVIIRFLNNNEFKNEIIQINWKTLCDSHDTNFCFEKFLHILTCVFDDHARQGCWLFKILQS